MGGQTLVSMMVNINMRFMIFHTCLMPSEVLVRPSYIFYRDWKMPIVLSIMIDQYKIDRCQRYGAQPMFWKNII